MGKTIWSWLRRWGQRGQEPSPTRSGTGQATPPAALPPLTPADYEFLFNQLLEGLVHGWDRHRLQKFFLNLERRTSIAHWSAWLEQFSQQVLAAPAPNLELARRLDLFVAQGQTLPELAPLLPTATHLATQIKLRQNHGVIWEYVGPDR